jgi:hypothetical protein
MHQRIRRARRLVRVVFDRRAPSPTDGSLSPDRFRARRMLVTAESDQEETCRAPQIKRMTGAVQKRRASLPRHD